MSKVKITILLLFISLNIYSTDFELNSILMRNTFLIEGNGSKGTAFLIGKPTRPGSEYYWKVLVTAKHVLDSIKGDFAIISFRKKIGDKYVEIKHRFKIRENKRNIYSSHPTMDVAAMYMLGLPDDVDLPLLAFWPQILCS